MIRSDLGKKATRKNYNKIGTIMAMICFSIFLTVGIVGYISMGDALIDLGIDIFPNRPGLGDSDLAMTIGKVGVIFVLIISNICRVVAIKKHFFYMIDREITHKANIFFTFTLMYLPSLIAFVYPQVNDWVSLLGAFCNSTLGVLFPALMGYKFYGSMANRKEEGMIRI